MGAESGTLTLEEMRLLVESAADVTFTGSLDGLMGWTSQGIVGFLGWTPEELVGTPFADLVHPEDRPTAIEGRRRADAGETARFRARVLAKDGSYRFVDILLRTRFDAAGEPVERFGSWRDAGSTVMLEQRLEGERSRLASVLDAMLDPWVLFSPVRDENGRIVDFVFADANARACEYNRLSRDELVGSSLLGLLPAHRGSALFASYVRVLDTGEPLVLDDFIYPREIFGGAERYYDIRATRVGTDMSYTWRDVTTRHEASARIARSEERLAAALSSEIDPHAFFEAVRDDNGRIVDLRFGLVNRAAEAYLGAIDSQLRGALLSEKGSPAFEAPLTLLAPVVDTGVPLSLDDWEVATLHGGPGRFLDLRAVKVGDGLSLMWRDITDVAHQRRAVAESQALLRAALEAELDGHLILEAVRDDDGTITDFRIAIANVPAAAYFDLSVDEAVGRTIRSLVTAEHAEAAVARYAHVAESGEPFSADRTPGLSRAGQGRVLDVRAVKALEGVSLTWRDVTEMVEAQRELAASEERFRLLAENSADLVCLIRDRQLVWASPSVRATMGGLGDDLPLTMEQFVHPDDLPAFEAAYADAEAGGDQLIRLRTVSPDGTGHWVEVHAVPYRDESGKQTGIVAAARIIDELVRAEEELEHRARFDLLTGLMNRTEVLRTVARVSQQRPRTGVETAILFCDIDKFKEINDTYGHAAGDEVLRTLGERLSATIRADDYAARIGGDELLVVLTGVHSLDEAVGIAEKIRAVVAEPIAFEHGLRVSTSMSIGVTLAHHGETTDQLVERADNAMYEAKRGGRDQVIAIG